MRARSEFLEPRIVFGGCRTGDDDRRNAWVDEAASNKRIATRQTADVFDAEAVMIGRQSSFCVSGSMTMDRERNRSQKFADRMEKKNEKFCLPR